MPTSFASRAPAVDISTVIDIVSVVGARPQFVKLAPISREFERRDGVAHRVIHTGQHYDDRMSAVFFEELELPRPDVDLGVGSGGHGAQTGAMLGSLESCFLERRPDVVLVYGDTNSTLAATLAATKIHVPVAHIEAGLRSFNRSMPEEINRLVADHCADRLYAPTPAAMHNLAAENLAGRAIRSGDVMRDAVLHNRELALQKSRALDELQLKAGQFGLLTIHRPVNTTAEALRTIITALEAAQSGSFPLVFPAHPRTRPLLKEAGCDGSGAIRIVEPLAYLDMLRLTEEAAIIVTDSGGVQKEAAFLETPCITLREETEWVETVELGVNRLVGKDGQAIRSAIVRLHDRASPFNPTVRMQLSDHYGDGNAATIIVDDLIRWVDESAVIKAH